MAASKDYEGLQKLEIRETDRFIATTDHGVAYTIIERTEFIHVTWPDKSKRSTPIGKTYETLNGHAVGRLSDHHYEITVDGVQLSRR